MKNELSLPNSWQMKTLGDLFEITSSKRVFKEDWKTEGVPFYRAREIVKLAENGFVNNELFISEEMFKEYSEKYGLPKESDVMVTGVGTLGICYVVKSDDRFYFKDGNIIWLKSNGKANSRYVEYAFKSDFLRKQIDDSVGATVGTYTIIKAKSTKIPLPPLPEQQRIVSILDEAFAAIAKAKANAEQNLKNAKELFESYLQGVFDPSTRSGQGKGDGWEEKKLGEVCNVIGGGTPSKANSKFYDGDIFWATVRDMKGEVIYDTEHKITKEAVKNSSTNIIPKGNVVIATRVGLGKVCLIENDTAINQDLRGIVPINSKKLSVDFLYHWLKSIAHKIVEEGTGATVQGVKLPFIKSLAIPLPPLKEQQTIVRQLNALRAETQKLEAVYQKKIDDLEELKKSILQKAFAGELKTSQEVV